MEFAAQAIGILAMLVNIVSYQFKSRKNVLFCMFAGSTLFAVNMFMIGAVMGGILNIVGIARALVYINKDKLKIPIKLLNTLFILVYAASYALSFTVFNTEPILKNFILELLPAIGMSVMTIALSGNDAKKIRLLGFVNSPCWLIYNCFNFAVGGILCEVFSLVSITAAFIRIDIMSKKEKV